MEGSSHAKNQLDMFSRFSRTTTCDGQTDGHRAMASSVCIVTGVLSTDTDHATVLTTVVMGCIAMWPKSISLFGQNKQTELLGVELHNVISCLLGLSANVRDGHCYSA